MNVIRIPIASLNKKTLKDIANIINDVIVTLPSHFKYMQWYIQTPDNIKSKLYQPELSKVTKKHPDSICHVQFSNEGKELINFPSIFNNTYVHLQGTVL